MNRALFVVLARVSIACALLGAPTAAASAETLQLRPAYRPGDRYSLSLGRFTETEASTLSLVSTRRQFFEDVELRYDAQVVILEVDDVGRPLRERHEEVRLTYVRGNRRGSLFGPGTAYEVERRDGGDVRLFVDGERVGRRVERVVSELLETRFDHGPGPALFDPGRPVEIDESWELDRGLARRFLRRQGVRALGFDRPLKATLRRRDGRLVVVFHIPVDWVTVKPLPASALASKSHAYLEGQVRLPGESGIGPITYSSNLDLRLSGRVGGSSASRARWAIRRHQSSDQTTGPVRRGTGRDRPRSDGIAAAYVPIYGPTATSR